MIVYKTLENTGIETIHTAFAEAFSDYPINRFWLKRVLRFLQHSMKCLS